MKAKTKFKKMFYKLPPEARVKLIYDAYGVPYTLNVIMFEIKAGTKLGLKLLKELGFEDD